VHKPGSHFEAWHAAINWASNSLSAEPEALQRTPSSDFFENVLADEQSYLRDETTKLIADDYPVFINFRTRLWSKTNIGTYDLLLQYPLESAFKRNGFSFWQDWYERLLAGDPLDWELQRRVALIDDAIWEAGPEVVAEEIDRIRAAYLVEKAPQAERVEFNPETAKFYTVPLEVTKPDLLGATLNQVQDALDDVLASPSNGLHDAAREVRVLRRVFTKYGNDPQQIEMGFVSVHKGLTRQILNDELPPSEENLALQDALEEGARAIRATHPDVAENRKILSNQAIRELPQGAKDALTEALPILVAISEPDLAEDWEHDIPQLINDATLPLPSGAPPLPGADEATRIFSRVAKISIHLKIAEIIHKIADSAGYKGAGIVQTIWDLVALGLKIFSSLG
jgi:hypothetical protein